MGNKLKTDEVIKELEKLKKDYETIKKLQDDLGKDKDFAKLMSGFTNIDLKSFESGIVKMKDNAVVKEKEKVLVREPVDNEANEQIAERANAVTIDPKYKDYMSELKFHFDTSKQNYMPVGKMKALWATAPKINKILTELKWQVRYTRTCPINETSKTTINGEIKIGAMKMTIIPQTGNLAMNEPIKISRVFTLLLSIISH